MPPTCYLSALWDLRAIHSSKHGLEKEELTQQAAWLAKASGKRMITMNLCGKLLNNFLHLCCCVVVFILLTRGKTAEVLYLDDSSCTA